MKLKNLLCGLAVVFSMAMVGCDKEDLEDVPPVIQQAFYEEYPGSKIYGCDVEAGFYKVESRINGKEAEVWFDMQANWVMTQYEILFKDLPTAIQTSFNGSEYAGWRAKDDDVYMVERTDLNNPVLKSITYIIEVGELYLHYTPEGILINDHGGVPGGVPQATVPTQISTFISQQYPNARIVEIEKELNGNYDVEIVEGMTAKEVLFTPNCEWISTSWDVVQIPTAVTACVTAKYPGYRIDDADYVQTPGGDYYELELESGRVEKHVRIKPDGTFIEEFTKF